MIIIHVGLYVGLANITIMFYCIIHAHSPLFTPTHPLQHGGISSPPTSPNSPSSASYGNNQPHSILSHSPPSLTPNTATSPISSQEHTVPALLSHTHIQTLTPTTPPPPPFVLPFSSHMSSSTSSSSRQSSCDQQEHGSVEEGEGQDMEGAGPYVCQWENCNMEFPNLSYLVAHLDRGHTATMVTYRCLWRDCQRDMKPFDARYKLITHLRCHTGEKPYKCDVKGCIRSFSRLENLKLHVRTHTGEKPYACHYDNCNKRFNNTSDRAKHMKTHITRKPYACKVPGCSKSYTDPSSMRKHVKFAHRMREGSSDSGSSSSTGSSSASWSRGSLRKVSSPVHLSNPPLLGSADRVSPKVLLRYPIPPLTKLPITTHSLTNRMSVIRQDDSITPSHQPVFSSLVSSSYTHNATQSSPTAVTASVPPLLPLSVVQVPGTTPGIQSALPATPTALQPVIMQVEGTNQKVVVFVPAASLPTAAAAVAKIDTSAGGGRIESQGQVQATLQNVLPPPQLVSAAIGRPSVLVSSHQVSQNTAPGTPPATSSGFRSLQLGQSPESAAVGNQVRMQVANLQQQLQSSFSHQKSPQSSNYPIQLPSTPVVTQTTVPSPLRAAMAVPNIKEEAIPIGVHPTPQTIQQAPGTPVFFPAANAQSLMLQPQLVQPSRVTQYVQPANIVQIPQLPNLSSVNVAQTVMQPASSTSQAGSSVAIKPLTVVNPSQCLGLSGAQTVVLPSGQVFSVVPSTTHLLLPQGSLSQS